jgi:uncharacterized membrane protein
MLFLRYGTYFCQIIPIYIFIVGLIVAYKKYLLPKSNKSSFSEYELQISDTNQIKSNLFIFSS